MKVINIVLLFFAIIFSYQILISESTLITYLFLFLLLWMITLLWNFMFYKRNLNYIFTCKDDKLIIHTAFNMYVFDINNAYIKSGGKGINSYFFICDISTNKKIKFYCLFFGNKKFEILKEQLDKLFIRTKYM